MSKILCIETSTPVCSVAIIDEISVISYQETDKKNSHSEILTVFIEDLLKEVNLKFTDLDAIAVSKGPGSYTGLRIGVSTAKGLCYALDIPLIAINTLQSMASGMIEKYQDKIQTPYYFVPMIDARRMEVYSAIYDINLNIVRKTEAEIIDESSFSEYLEKNKMIFFGDGSDKCKEVLNHQNALFEENIMPSAVYMAKLVNDKFIKQEFEDVAYFEPFYLKDFIAGIPKVKGLR